MAHLRSRCFSVFPHFVMFSYRMQRFKMRRQYMRFFNAGRSDLKFNLLVIYTSDYQVDLIFTRQG